MRLNRNCTSTISATARPILVDAFYFLVPAALSVNNIERAAATEILPAGHAGRVVTI